MECPVCARIVGCPVLVDCRLLGDPDDPAQVFICFVCAIQLLVKVAGQSDVELEIRDRSDD